MFGAEHPEQIPLSREGVSPTRCPAAGSGVIFLHPQSLTGVDPRSAGRALGYSCDTGDFGLGLCSQGTSPPLLIPKNPQDWLQEAISGMIAGAQRLR